MRRCSKWRYLWAGSWEGQGRGIQIFWHFCQGMKSRVSLIHFHQSDATYVSDQWTASRGCEAKNLESSYLNSMQLTNSGFEIIPRLICHYSIWGFLSFKAFRAFWKLNYIFSKTHHTSHFLENGISAATPVLWPKKRKWKWKLTSWSTNLGL